jgi:hypothetical protein
MIGAEREGVELPVPGPSGLLLALHRGDCISVDVDWLARQPEPQRGLIKSITKPVTSSRVFADLDPQDAVSKPETDIGIATELIGERRLAVTHPP